MKKSNYKRRENTRDEKQKGHLQKGQPVTVTYASIYDLTLSHLVPQELYAPVYEKHIVHSPTVVVKDICSLVYSHHVCRKHTMKLKRVMTNDRPVNIR